MTIGWHFDNTYSKLSNTFKEHIKPTPVHDPELVVLNEKLATDLKLKKTLWDALYTWTGKTVLWLNQPFEAVDPFVIEKEVQTYFKVAVSSAKKLPDSN